MPTLKITKGKFDETIDAVNNTYNDAYTLIKKNNHGEWIVTIGRYAGRTLAWCIQWRGGWLIGWALCTAGVTPEEIDIVDAALAERTRRMTIVSRARRLIREAHRPLVRG